LAIRPSATISTNRRHRLIQKWPVTDAAAHEGSRLEALLDPGNTAAAVWADSGYRSKKNEAPLSQRMLVSCIHCKKVPHRPMSKHTARANAKTSTIRVHIKHVFVEQKARMGLFIRTIERQQTLDPISAGAGRGGIARVTTKIGSPTSSTTCAGWSGSNIESCQAEGGRAAALSILTGRDGLISRGSNAAFASALPEAGVPNR
jgi:hypothetical protein